MKATNDNSNSIGKFILSVVALLLYCATIAAQGVFQKDTTLVNVSRNLMSFTIPEGSTGMDVTIRFTLTEVSAAGIMYSPSGYVNPLYRFQWFKSDTKGSWEYALVYRPDASFPCDSLAYLPPGTYRLRVRSSETMEAHTLRFVLVVDNLPGVTETDSPIGYLPDNYDGFLPEPDSEPKYPAASGNGRTAGRSHVVSREMTDTSGTSYMEDIRYFDGLGRPVQTLYAGAASDGSDLADFTDYSTRGRVWRQWKPTAVTGFSGAFISDLPSRARTQHADSRPYTETIHAECPLDRPMSVTAKGDAWAKHPERIFYTCNTENGNLSCRQFSVSPTAALRDNGVYPAAVLHVVRHTDADGNLSFRFTDKQGRTVLDRVMNGSVAHDTYYVYDASGLLRFVLPPAMDGDFSVSAQERYAYRYTYDGLGRLTEKKLPGCPPVKYVYDAMDRVAFSQDGNGAVSGKWKFYAYDALGHEVATGMMPLSGTPLSSIPVWTKDYTTANGTSAGIATTGYSTAYGYPSEAEVYTVNYYSDYNYLQIPVFKAVSDSLQYRSLSGYDTRATSEGSTYGKLTGTRLRSTAGDEILTAYYYDTLGRVVQKASTNHLGGYDRYLYGYDFRGKVVSSMHIHSAPGKQTLTETCAYTYDHRERLLEVRHRLNGGSEVLLARYTYDNQGRRNTVSYHNGAENLTYSYNIQDWLTGISGTKFTQTLGYGSHYNGNISSMDWTADGASHSYTFTYDGLNRLRNAIHGTGAYTEKVTEYDKNGNILALQRYDNGLIDALTYTYNGNRLTQVEDSTGHAAGFTDGASTANEYTYDNNGNLTKDLNKGISGIAYNSLNLPIKVTFNDGSTIDYVYAADGNKLRTVHVISGTTTQKDYCGNVVYENGIPKLLLTEVGYVDLSASAPAYCYYLKDHQGNNRVVINSSGTVQETNHYYPFGGLFASTGNVQPYKYNGKELDTKKGLDWYDYGARHYDAALGRWFVVDPLAEERYSNSVYSYTGNNSINKIDPNGMLDDWVKDKDGNIYWDKNAISQATTKDGETYLGKAVVIFNGSRNERLGQGNILGGEGGVSAQVIVYAPDGKKYDDLVGYTMTSNADAYTPIDEGEYTAKRRKEKGSGQIPKYYQLFENGVDNIRTMDGVRNNNPKYRHQIRENGDGGKATRI